MIVSDLFGRAWRQGTLDVALGVAGMRPLLDLRGTRDGRGYELQTTMIAVADALAGAAELVKQGGRRARGPGPRLPRPGRRRERARAHHAP